MTALLQEASKLSAVTSTERKEKVRSILTQLVASKSELAVTPGLKDSLEKIDGFVTVIQDKIKDEHTQSMEFAATSFSAFATCSDKLTTTTEGEVADAKQAYEDLKSPNQECRADEGQEKDEHDDCEAGEAEKLGVKTNNCEVFDEAEKRAIDVAAHKRFVDFLEDEGSYAYITRLHEHFKKLWEEFVAAKEVCDTATTDHDNEKTKCDAAEADHGTKKDECDTAQENMDDAACGYAVKSKQACTTYDNCYSAAKTSYESTVAVLQSGVADRKGEWEATERINCLTSTFGDSEEEGSTHDVAGMQECLNKAIPTDHLDINFEPTAAADTCAPDMS